jgi:hypothetical protein
MFRVFSCIVLIGYGPTSLKITPSLELLSHFWSIAVICALTCLIIFLMHRFLILHHFLTDYPSRYSCTYLSSSFSILCVSHFSRFTTVFCVCIRSTISPTRCFLILHLLLLIMPRDVIKDVFGWKLPSGRPFRPDVCPRPRLPRGRGFTRGRIFTVRGRSKNRVRADAQTCQPALSIVTLWWWRDVVTCRDVTDPPVTTQ